MRAAIAVTCAAALIAGGGLSACSHGANRTEVGAKPDIVASADVWGSVAQAVAGDDADVHSIIHTGSADPHSYEAIPADAAAISDASLVVYNGGGYDAWVDGVLAHSDVPTVDAYSLLDAAALGEPQPANEHVFYDLGTAKAVAEQIADKLAVADPTHSGEYHSRAKEFGTKADAILNSEHSIGTAHPGAAVVATEPVAHYLLLAAKLTDKTPKGFTAAIEQDTDPAPVDVAAMLDLITEHQVDVLIFNDQTATAATKQIRDAAQRAGVPIVAVTETLPAGSDYLSWQTDTANRLAEALR